VSRRLARLVLLDSNSRAGATFATTAPAGTRYRLRAVVHGNNRNVRTPGAWQYLRFT